MTGELHTVLASDESDPAFAPEKPSAESLGLLTATIDEEIAERLPDAARRRRAARADRRPRRGGARAAAQALTHAGSTGKIIRTHGDYHLGQVLWADGDWVVIDFEGEPARSLAERRRKRSPLRDVAGMLRSFAYASIASHRFAASTCRTAGRQARARSSSTATSPTVEQTLLPPGREAIERLLAVFELEKAVYELRYELDNRPDWVGIPVAGILRLIESAATTP